MIVLRQDSRNVETKFRNIQILPEDPESFKKLTLGQAN